MSSNPGSKVPVTRVLQPHHTDFGYCLTTPQLCEALAAPSCFTAVAGATRRSLNPNGQTHEEGVISSRSNFAPCNTIPMPGSKFLGSAKNRMTDYVQGKVNDFDHCGQAGSAWGHSSVVQLEALEKQEKVATYARTSTTAMRGDADNDGSAWSAMDESHEEPPSIFDKPGPLGVSDLGSIKAEFENTSRPLTLASFATISYMDGGIDIESPNHRFIANNEEPGLVSHIIGMANSSVISPAKPIRQSLQDWEAAAKSFDDHRLAGNRCLTLQPQAFAQILAECEELVYTQGTYCGVLDTVALPSL
jgi:hypothetical protein